MSCGDIETFREVGARLLGPQPGRTEPRPPPPRGKGPGPTPPPATTAPPTTDPPPPPAAPTTTTAAEGLPDGWAPFADPEGAYTIGLPPGWQVRRTDVPYRIDLVDSGTGSFLRIEWTDSPKPDPVADWREQAESFASRNASYQEIGIAPVDYRDYDAALWEFTHSSGGETGARPARFDGTSHDAPLYARAALLAGDVIAGPAVIEEFSSTVPLAPGYVAEVDDLANLRIRRREATT